MSSPEETLSRARCPWTATATATATGLALAILTTTPPLAAATLGSVRSAGFVGAVAARTGGGYVAAWRDADGVRFRVLDETAQPLGGVRVLPAEPALLLGALDVGASADSGFVVVWASGTKLWSARCGESAECSRPAVVGVADHGILEARLERRGNAHLLAFVRPRPSLGSFEFGSLVVQRLDGSARASSPPSNFSSALSMPHA